MRFRRVLAVVFAALAMLATTVTAVALDVRPAAAATVAPEVATALELAPADLVDVEESADPAATVVTSAPAASFPTEGDDYLLLSTGVATDVPGGNPAEDVSTDLEAAPPGVDGNDMTRVRLRLNPPVVATCLSFEFQFLSDEYPEWVGSSFNDVFTAELNSSDLTKVGNDIVAPRNFAFDSEGNVVSVNALFGFTAMPDGSTRMDGGSPVLVAVTPLERLPESTMVDLILTIQDIGDSILDSSVSIDNLQWGFGGDCTAGAFVTPPDFVAPTPECDSTLPVQVGETATFDVAAAHDDEELEVTLSASDLPPGASTTPALPAAGNPVTTAVSWTPGASDTGDHVVTFEANVPGGQPASCTLTLRVAGSDDDPTITKVASPSTVTADGEVTYTITIANPGAEPIIGDGITDALPAGFSYRPGTTSGATTADPAVSGEMLIWPGPFSVPAGGTIELQFGARAASTPGTYLNEASFSAQSGLVGTGPTAPVTVVSGALHLTKTADDTVVKGGADTGYTITVHNDDETPAELTSIVDTLPVGFSYRAGTTTGLSTADPAVDGRTLTWNGPFTVPASSTASLHFGVTAATLAGDYLNEAEATATDAVVGPTGPTALITVIDHLLTTKVVDAKQVRPGGSMRYTITVTNPNATARTLTSISDTLPAGFAYQPDSTTGATTTNPTVDGQVLTWTGSWPVPAGGQRTLSFGATAGSEAGTFTNEAGAVATGAIVEPTGPTAPVTVIGSLTTTKVADVSTALPGGAVGYTITVVNPNPSGEIISAITDTLPPDFSYIAGSTTGITSANPTITGSTLRWAGAFFIPGGGGTVSLHFLAAAASTPGEYLNNATATAIVGAVLPTGPTAPVLVALPLTLSAEADNSPVRINALAPHTITIVNPNSIPAPLVIDAEIPPGFTYVAGSTTGLTTADPAVSGRVLTWSEDLEVEPFSTATLHYVVKATGIPGSYVTHVDATTEPLSINPATAPIVVNSATGLTAAPAIAEIKAGSPKVHLTLSATLRYAAGTKPVVGKRVDFRAGGLAVCSGITNGQGVATCGGVIGAAQAVLGLGYTAVFPGDAHYLRSTATGRLLVINDIKI